VASISWQGLVEFLLRPPTNSAPALIGTARLRYTVINTFPLTPAVSGGQARLLGIYRQLARHADIRFINLGGARSPHYVRTLAPGLTEEIVPRTAAFLRAEQDLEKIVQASAGDLAAALYPNLVPAWLSAIEQASKDADALICSHPYGHPALAATGYRGKLFYEGHNIESDLKQSIYQGQPWPLAEIRRIEGDCITAADGITVCSAEEAVRLQELYDIQHQRIAIVPNGVDAAQTPFQTLTARRVNQRRYSLRKPVALFIGSAHQPNVEAAELLLQTARDCSEFDFVFMGSVCKQLDGGVIKLSRNVRSLGVVSEAEKSRWLALADAGLNPIISGAGTNLKLAEYAAAGLPIISTKFGARGGVFTEGVHYLVAEPQQMDQALRQLVALSEAACGEMIKLADASVRRTLDWQVIAEDYAIFLTA
jgi:glycosyltransferase involved in cell wall biosynthesis